MTIALVFAGFLCVLATLGSLHRHPAWWVRACDFPRLQIAALALLVLIGLAITPVGAITRLSCAALMLAVLAYQLVVILPYSALRPVEVTDSRRPAGGDGVRLMVANVLMTNRHATRLLRLIEERTPDLILAVETDRWWRDRLAELDASHPFEIANPLDNTYGMVLRSRLELVDPEVRFLVKDDVPSIRTGVRLASGNRVLLHGIHPEPPSPTEADTALPRDAELILIGREVAEHPGPTIVAGDLNDVAWSHTSRLFRRLSGLLDPRIGRGMFNTFHARIWPCRWPLDHIFVSADFTLRHLERLPAFGSDHFAVLIALDHEPQAAARHDPPTPDVGDHHEVVDKLEQAADELDAPHLRAQAIDASNRPPE